MLKSLIAGFLVTSQMSFLIASFLHWSPGDYRSSGPKFAACSSWELCLNKFPCQMIPWIHNVILLWGRTPPDLQTVSMKTAQKRPSENIRKPILYSIDSIDITLLVDGRTGCITIANWGDVSWEIPQREVHSRKSSVSARMCDSRLKHTSLQ